MSNDTFDVPGFRVKVEHARRMVFIRNVIRSLAAPGAPKMPQHSGSASKLAHDAKALLWFRLSPTQSSDLVDWVFSTLNNTPNLYTCLVLDQIPLVTATSSALICDKLNKLCPDAIEIALAEYAEYMRSFDGESRPDPAKWAVTRLKALGYDVADIEKQVTAKTKRAKRSKTTKRNVS